MMMMKMVIAVNVHLVQDLDGLALSVQTFMFSQQCTRENYYSHFAVMEMKAQDTK